MWLLEVTFTNMALLASVLMFLLYKYLSINFNYWKDRGLVHIKPHILFGAYKDMFMLRSTAGTINTKIYHQFPNEKFVGSFRMGVPELMIKDPDLIKQVLVKDFSSFSDRSNDVTSDHEGINLNLFRVQGDKWKAIRFKLTPAFTSTKLKNMFHLIVEKGKEFQNFLELNVKDSDEQEVRDFTARFTTDVIGSCAFGLQTNSINNSNSSFRSMGDKIFKPSVLRLCKAILGILSPKTFVFLRLKLISMEVENFFISMMKEITAERQKTDVKRQDFIDILLELKGNGHIIIKSNSNSDKKIEFTDTFMAAQAFIFFAAGFETSSTLMACTLYELAKNPDIQDKVLIDIKNALNKNGGVMCYEAIADMHYLECTISETMRKYPALGTLTRVCGSTYTFPGTNLTIDKKCTIVIPVQAMHYDPKYFPEPEKFIPERFTPEAKLERHPMVYLPFGEGPRNCIGMRFGKMQSMVGLVSFLTKFSVEPSPRTESKLTMNPLAFVSQPKYGVWLKIKPRK